MTIQIQEDAEAASVDTTYIYVVNYAPGIPVGYEVI